VSSVSASALIHRARVVTDEPTGTKDGQGERVRVEAHGPWFACRLMPRRPGREEQREGGGRKRTTKPWSLIWGDEDEAGGVLVFPTAADVVEVERDLGGTVPVVQRFEIAGQPSAFDAGDGPFGGQADLDEVKDSA
jgi:hypothetical protein